MALCMCIVECHNHCYRFTGGARLCHVASWIFPWMRAKRRCSTSPRHPHLTNLCIQFSWAWDPIFPRRNGFFFAGSNHTLHTKNLFAHTLNLLLCTVDDDDDEQRNHFWAFFVNTLFRSECFFHISNRHFYRPYHRLLIGTATAIYFI